MTIITINSDNSMSDAIGVIRELYKRHRYLKLNIRMGKDRSIDQNSISHAWYEQIARELREDNAQGWKRYCKLHFGVPILRAEDEKFREFYDQALKSRTYETKLQAMDFVPITSIMTKPQLSAYLEAMQSHFMKQSVILDLPQE